LNAQVLGISVDHVPALTAWAEGFGGINYPLLSDFWPHGEVSQKYGVLRSEGHSERALFIVDAKGVVQYIDIHDIDDLPDNEVLLTELRRIDPVAASKEPQGVEQTKLPSGGIVMYCSKWCKDCMRAREWLRLRGLEYTEVDIYATPGATKQVREWAGGPLVTPTFDIDGRIILDFDEEKLKEIIG
jgi:glutaredoxin